MWVESSTLILFTLLASQCWCSSDTRNASNYRVMAELIPTAFSGRVSPECLKDSLVLVDGITRSEKWAVNMLDASGKLRDIYFNANKHAMGHFDQCLGVNAPDFKAKYCSVFIQDRTIQPLFEDKFKFFDNVPNSVHVNYSANHRTLSNEPRVTTTRNYHQPRLSLCVPSSCLAIDVGLSISSLLRSRVTGNLSSVLISVVEDFCFAADIDAQASRLSTRGVIVGTIFSALAGIIFAGTIVDGWNSFSCDVTQRKDEETFATKSKSSSEGKLTQILICFSVISNLRKVLSTQVLKDKSFLAPINGIRFILMCWIVLGHTWIQGLLLYNQNIEGLRLDGRKWAWQLIVNGTIAVDGFFLLSGLLVSYHLLDYLNQTKGKLHLMAFYTNRYVRLTPAYFAVFSFVSTLLVHCGSGPSWFQIKYMASNCQKVWWQHFLFINNFIPKEADQLCMPETWYLANEVQLFLVSPFLIYSLWRWKKNGLIILTTITLSALAANVALFYAKNMPPTSMITRPLTMSKSMVDFWVYYYPQPWFRSPPYLVGIFLGYVLHTNQKQTIHMPKVLVIFGWLLSAGTCILIIYGLSPYTDEDLVPEIHPAVNVFYGAFHRFAWALGLSWVIFACCHGYGGFVNDLLASPIFIPLGRLSYCVYLIHYNVIQAYYALKRQPPYYTPTEQLYATFGNIIISLILSLIVCVTVETPFINLANVILPSRAYLKGSREKYCPSEMTKDGESNRGFTIT